MEAVMERPHKKHKQKPKPKAQHVSSNDSSTNVEDVCNDPCLKVEVIDASHSSANTTSELESCSPNTEPANHDIKETKPQLVVKHADSTLKIKEVPYKEEKVQQDQQNFERFLDINKQLLRTLENIDCLPAQPAGTLKNTLSQIRSDESFDIRPYTEQQLYALYYNSELNVLGDFTKSFVEAELGGLHLKKHILYDLLSSYLKAREKITGNNIGIDQLRDEYRNLQVEIWTKDTVTARGSAACQDGKVVFTSQDYDRSIFQTAVFQNVIRTLGNIQELIFESHALLSYLAEDLRLQIQLYVEQTIENVVSSAQLTKKSPVLLRMEDEPMYLKPYFNEVRFCVSVLFAFQRKLIKDKQFLEDLQGWLTQLVAVLVKIANYQDHLFLIHHILRCPAGVSTWASSFIQVPLDLRIEEPFANYQINHLLSVLSVILSPVKERKEFLKDIVHCQSLPTEANWVLIDSDGEEDEEVGISLRENDMVGLLNQLPLGDMFRCILLINRTDSNDKYDMSLLTEQHVLRFFAFSSILLKLLHRGLETYCQPKYNQFSKRLSRFIRHVVQYASDQWELCLKAKRVSDPALMQRLQIEYDAFFLRAIYCLYSSQKLRAWQFLAVVPYNLVTMKVLWKIYYILHMPDEKAEDIIDFSVCGDFKELMRAKELKEHFEEKLNSLDDAEVYYLLNTFANMALARNEEDFDFIYVATMDILQVGFVFQATRDTCLKSARILLVHLTSKYPSLLSIILNTVQEKMDTIGASALDLYEDIPLSIWALTDDDMTIIERLLLNFPVNSNETKLARMILSRLNWNLLPYEKHCDTAILVLKAVQREPAYSQWGWQTILRLKLHISDGHFQELGKIQELERWEILLKGVRENHPLTCFVAILMTTWGHLVPLICSNGLNQLITLQTNQKHEAVLFALYQILPIFIKCQECIVNCDKYQEVLINLLNADRGYISYAKSFIMTSNTVLQQFGNMVETQIANYASYDVQSPKLLVRLWMNSLVSIPNWNKDGSVLYLLDVIIRSAFFYQDSLQIITENFRLLYQANTPQESGSIISIFKWTSGSNSSGYSLLPNSLAQYPWLAYVFLEIEHQEREVKTGLWVALLNELSKQKGKISVDNAIKAVTVKLKLVAFSSNCLCIYRWAQQAMDTPLNHPVLPLLWFKFFILYLTRLPHASPLGNTCVGEKFFEGIVNFTFLKRIKKKLQESIDFYKNEIEACSREDLSENVDHYKLRHKVFQALLLWLEEPRLQSGNLLLHNLPVQYEPTLLAQIIQNSQVPWYEYLDRNQIFSDQAAAMKLWRVANFREKSHVNEPLSNPGHGVESSDPIERILRRLASYDDIKRPPELKSRSVAVPQTDLTNKELMFKSLKPHFETLNQFACDHGFDLSELKALNCRYKELVPQLFSSVLKVIKKKVPCNGKNQTVLCSGPAIVVLQIQEIKRNDRIEHEIQVNRQSYELLLKKSLQPPPITLCTASVCIQQCVRELQQQLETKPETAELGVELFYHILALFQEEVASYLPAKTLFVCCLEKLGQSHICGVEYEMPRLLQWIVNEPNLGEYLVPYFSPINTGNSNMLLMYSTITKRTTIKYDIIFALMSKFDIDKWLKDKSPTLTQRSQLIGNIIDALSALGYDPPVDALTLHGLYRKHLMSVFDFQFPEHYGDILLHLLKASSGTPDATLISEAIWIDVLNSLAKPVKINPRASLRDQLRQYSQHQKQLSHQEIIDTSNLLARHFTQERLDYGLYGLYPKRRKYVDVLVLLVGMTGHSMILSMMNTHQGLLGARLCEQIWPYIREMFAPWLIPYSMHNLKDNMATWIQQLADDRSILLPWIPTDTELAEKMISAFCECISFILDTLPASFNVLSYVWQWYVTSYAHPSVKDYVLLPIHKALTALPWNSFWPSVMDLEFMLRVIDQYLPECHSFLGYVFVSIPWVTWITSFADVTTEMKSRIYQCFLSLLVKLSIEPNIRKNHLENARSILIQAENFNWNSLECPVFQHIMDWVVMSCNSGVIFNNDPLDLDCRLLCLLKLVSGYHKVLPQHPVANVIGKRQIYVKAHIKLLSVYVSRHQNVQNTKENEICKVLTGYLNDLDTVVTTSEEMEVLLKEIISIVNVTNISEIAVKVFIKWIQNKTYGLVTKVLLKILCTSVNDYNYLAVLYESTLTSYFNKNVMENNSEEPSWKKASQTIHICTSNPIEFERALIEEGSVLTLHAIALQRIQRNINNESLLDHFIGWIEKIKIRESLEFKVPLVWLNIINLALQQCISNQSTSRELLYKFSHILLQISDDAGSTKWGMGILNAIGLSKSEVISINFRFICRAMAAYTLAQLPEGKVLTQKVRVTANSPSAVGTPGGNNECPKVLLGLDFRQSQGKIKDCAEIALTMIQNPENSLHNANSFLWTLLKQFYIKPYLRDTED